MRSARQTVQMTNVGAQTLSIAASRSAASIRTIAADGCSRVPLGSEQSWAINANVTPAAIGAAQARQPESAMVRGCVSTHAYALSRAPTRHGTCPPYATAPPPAADWHHALSLHDEAAVRSWTALWTCTAASLAKRAILRARRWPSPALCLATSKVCHISRLF